MGVQSPGGEEEPAGGPVRPQPTTQHPAPRGPAHPRLPPALKSFPACTHSCTPHPARQPSPTPAWRHQRKDRPPEARLSWPLPTFYFPNSFLCKGAGHVSSTKENKKVTASGPRPGDSCLRSRLPPTQAWEQVGFPYSPASTGMCMTVPATHAQAPQGPLRTQYRMQETGRPAGASRSP